MYKLTESQAAVVAAFKALPLKERKDTTLHSILRTLGDQANRDWYQSDEYKAEQAANERKAKARKERETERAQEAVEVAKTLQSGTLIKVKGTRDGHGIREVISIDRYQIVAWKMERCRTGWRRSHETTTHGLEKFVKILDRTQYNITT